MTCMCIEIYNYIFWYVPTMYVKYLHSVLLCDTAKKLQVSVDQVQMLLCIWKESLPVLRSKDVS